MSGQAAWGTCEICGKQNVPLERTYFHYGFQCDCHSPQHFKCFIHCSRCVPKKPAELVYIERLTAERDQWKRRAEALERAIKTDISYRCYICRNYEFQENRDGCHEECLYCSARCTDGSRWEFDEARFAPEDGEDK